MSTTQQTGDASPEEQFEKREAPAAFEPRLDSLADVENQANQLLAEYISMRGAAANLSIVPKTIVPGYEYPVPGITEDLVLREIQFEDGRRGRLKFTDDEDIVAVLAGLGQEVKQTKDAF